MKCVNRCGGAEKRRKSRRGKIDRGDRARGILRFLRVFTDKKYRVRKDFYKQYYTFNRDFLNEIAFSRRALEVWLEKKQFSGSFETTLGSFMIALKSGDTALETV